MQTHGATNILAFFQRIGWGEVLVILIAALLLFGGKRLPELARGLARGIKSFKKEMRSVGEEMREAMDADEPPPQPPPDDSPGSPPDEPSR